MPKTKLGTGNDVVELAMKSDELEFYIEWAATPKSMRGELQSQEKLAKHLGVSGQTIRNWKRDPRVQTRVDRIQSARIRIDQYPDIVDSLYVQATDPQNTRSVQASKLLLEVMWRSVDEASTASDLSLMSVKELKQLAAGLYDELDDREHDGETAAGS